VFIDKPTSLRPITILPCRQGLANSIFETDSPFFNKRKDEAAGIIFGVNESFGLGQEQIFEPPASRAEFTAFYFLCKSQVGPIS